jgi:hypothetical protein
MKMSESLLKIAPALLKAQKEIEGAKKGANNPFFKSKYADFNAVLEACKGPLNDNGITILQPHRVLEREGDVVGVVETVLLHETGEFISSETLIKCAKQNDPQALGSAITYAKRYGLQSLVVLPSEDDDGEKSMGRSNAKQVTKAPAKPAAKPAPKVEAKPEPTAEKPAETTRRRRRG